MRSLPSAVSTLQNATSRKSVILLEIELSDSITLRYARSANNISFGGNTYTAKAIEFGSVQHTIEGGIGEISIQIDNTNKAINDYFIYYDFYYKKMTVKRIYLDSNDNPPSSSSDYVEYFYGYISEVSEVNYNWFSIKGILSYDLKNKALLYSYSYDCRHVFGDAQCNQDGHADIDFWSLTSTATSGSTTQLVDTAHYYSDIWFYGKIEITINSIVYKRIVVNTGSTPTYSTYVFDFPLPVSVSNGDAYQVWGGCKKDWDSCKALNNWGPSTDNTANFGGFIHINDNRDA